MSRKSGKPARTAPRSSAISWAHRISRQKHGESSTSVPFAPRPRDAARDKRQCKNSRRRDRRHQRAKCRASLASRRGQRRDHQRSHGRTGSLGKNTENPPPQCHSPRGLAMLREIKDSVKIPVVAIGGINEQNVAQVWQAGADSAAIISDLMGAQDLSAKTRRILHLSAGFKTEAV